MYMPHNIAYFMTFGVWGRVSVGLCVLFWLRNWAIVSAFGDGVRASVLRRDGCFDRRLQAIKKRKIFVGVCINIHTYTQTHM